MSYRCFLIALATLAFTSTAPAQEAQVPLDKAGQVEVITANMETQLNLWPEIDHFQRARLFRSPDDSYSLVIQYRSDDGQLLREQRTLSPEEVEELRRRVSRGLADRDVPAKPDLNHEGRYELLAATTFYGAVQGVLIPAALDLESERLYTALPFLAAAGGFFVPFLQSRGVSVTEAQATGVGYGGLLGLGHGPLLGHLLLGESVTGQSFAALASFFSAGEAIAGYQWGRHRGAGTVEATGLGGLFGAGFGIGTGVLIQGEDFMINRLGSGITLLESIGGSYAGYRLARAYSYTKGDARTVGLAGSLGLQLATAALVLTEVDPARPAAGVLMGGTAMGLGIGHVLVRGHDFTEFHSNILGLGSLAGSLLGTAFAVLVASEEVDQDKIYATLSSLGSTAGFGLTYAIIAGEAQAGGGNLGLRLQVQPAGAFAHLLSGTSGQVTPIPRVSLQGRF